MYAVWGHGHYRAHAGATACLKSLPSELDSGAREGSCADPGEGVLGVGASAISIVVGTGTGEYVTAGARLQGKSAGNQPHESVASLVVA